MGSHNRGMAKKLAVELFLMVVAGLILGAIGPFGTYDTPTGTRMLLWVLMILAGYPIFKGLGTVSRWLSATTHIPETVATPLALMVAAAPMTLIVATLFFRASLGDALRWEGLPGLYLQVAIVGVLIHLATSTILAPRNKVDEPQAPSDRPAPAPQLQTPPAPADFAAAPVPLPPGLGTLVALKGEDHYVRAIGTDSAELMLMRLRDAIAQLGGDTEGQQVHRSWWVARAGIERIERQGREARIRLVTGEDVPVARDAMPRLRAAGWL